NLEAVQQFGKLWQLEPEDEIKEEKNPRPPDEDDIALLKTCIRKLSFLNPSFSLGPYSTSIKKMEKEIKNMAKKVNDLCGIELCYKCVHFTHLVARCTNIINLNSEDAKYVINVKQIAK
ncbi:hypothetical protein CUMW_209770, partial [Citrus unshiu]